MRDTDMNEALEHLVGQLMKAQYEGNAAAVVDEPVLQKLTECVIRIYAQKMEYINERQGGFKLAMPVSQDANLSETEIMLFVNKLLDHKKIDLFELQMFRHFCVDGGPTCRL